VTSPTTNLLADAESVSFGLRSLVVTTTVLSSALLPLPLIGRMMKRSKVDVMIAPENAIHLVVVLVLCQRRPHAVPVTVLLELHRDAAMSLVPVTTPPSQIKRLIRHRNSGGVGDSPRTVRKIPRVAEDGLQTRIHL